MSHRPRRLKQHRPTQRAIPRISRARSRSRIHTPRSSRSHRKPSRRQRRSPTTRHRQRASSTRLHARRKLRHQRPPIHPQRQRIHRSRTRPQLIQQPLITHRRHPRAISRSRKPFPCINPHRLSRNIPGKQHRRLRILSRHHHTSLPHRQRQPTNPHQQLTRTPRRHIQPPLHRDRPFSSNRARILHRPQPIQIVDRNPHSSLHFAARAFAFLSVIPEGNLLLHLLLFF